jgi:hypothetical protein
MSDLLAQIDALRLHTIIGWIINVVMYAFIIQLINNVWNIDGVVFCPL